MPEGLRIVPSALRLLLTGVLITNIQSVLPAAGWQALQAQAQDRSSQEFKVSYCKRSLIRTALMHSLSAAEEAA